MLLYGCSSRHRQCVCLCWHACTVLLAQCAGSLQQSSAAHILGRCSCGFCFVSCCTSCVTASAHGVMRLCFQPSLANLLMLSYLRRCSYIAVHLWMHVYQAMLLRGEVSRGSNKSAIAPDPPSTQFTLCPSNTECSAPGTHTRINVDISLAMVHQCEHQPCQ